MGHRVDAASTVALVGAGASVEAGLPDARMLGSFVLEQLIRDQSLARQVSGLLHTAPPHRHARAFFRFEQLMDEIKQRYDERLDLLGFMDLAEVPSPLQRQLAAMALGGTRLLTVNFDDLLERAVDLVAGWPAARTLDGGRPLPRLPEAAVGIVKLHGTRRTHGGREDQPIAPVQAALKDIVLASPGTRLNETATHRLQRWTRGRTLLVVGYSASDIFDVVPALEATRPRQVIWLQYAKGAPRQGDLLLREVAPVAAGLVSTWRRHGSTVRVIAGSPVAALVRLFGLSRPRHQRVYVNWRGRIEEWARAAKRTPDHRAGRPLAAALLGDADHFPEAAAVRRRIRVNPNTAPAEHWRSIGEALFLDPEADRATVRRYAHRALKAAQRDQDLDDQARALLLEARTMIRDPKTINRGIALLRQALQLAPKGSLVEADVRQFLASGLNARGHRRLALRHGQRAVKLYRQGGMLSGVLDALTEVAGAAERLDELELARRAYKEAIVHAERLGLPGQLFAARGNYAGFLIDRGYERAGLAQAKAALREASEEMAGPDGAQRFPDEGWAMIRLIADTELDLGQAAAAVMTLTEGLKQPAGSRAHSEAGLWIVLAEAYLVLGQREAATEALRRAWDLPNEAWLIWENAPYDVLRYALGEGSQDAVLEHLRRARRKLGYHEDICVPLARTTSYERVFRRDIQRALHYACERRHRGRARQLEAWIRPVDGLPPG